MADEKWTTAEADQLLQEYMDGSDKTAVVKRWAETKSVKETSVRNKIQAMRTARGLAKWSSYKNPYSRPALLAYQREHGLEKVLEAGKVMAAHVQEAEALAEAHAERLRAFNIERDRLVSMGLINIR